jgi:hypothetical protein
MTQLKLLGRAFGMLLPIALAGTGAGCTNHHDGELQQNWSIAGTTNTNACVVHGAVQARLVVSNVGQFVEATQFTPCDAFVVTLSLPSDTFTSDLTFLDGAGVPVSQTFTSSPFTIFRDTTTFVAVDFPPQVFFH